MDIAQNSIVAGADNISLILEIIENPRKLVCEISDNGRGMDAEFLKSVTDPFKTTRTTRNVGLGIPLLKLSAEMAEGSLTIKSVPLKGTVLKAEFLVGHIDRIPIGDISGTITMLIMAHPEITWKIQFSSLKCVFELNTDEIKNQLGEVPISNIDVLEWIQNTVNEGIKAVFGGVLDEVD